MNKKGVTLITLVIAVIILAIIAGTVITDGTGTIRLSQRAKFAEEVTLIEDAVEEYYITTGKLPVLAENTYTAEEIINLNTTGRPYELTQEIEKNKDTNSIFYMIDFSNINVKIQDRGIGKTQDDMYVVSENNNVYYVRGVVVEGEVYFSLINISKINKLD